MKLITLTGGSATGKDFIVKNILSTFPKVKLIVSHTTRLMRKAEAQDREYHFIDIKTATDMLNNGEFVETRQYFVANKETWLYGIHKSEIDLDSDNIYIAIVDYQGLNKIKKYLKENNCLESLTSIYINSTYQTRLKRSLDREGNMTNEQVLEVVRRLQDDIEFVDIAQNHCDICLDNNTIEDLVNIINKIRELV